MFLDPKWLILSLVPVWLWLIQLLILLYPKANLPEVKAIKWMASVAEQALMLFVVSTLLSQGMIYFIYFLSIPESKALLAASAVIISGAGSTVTLETKVDSDGNESYHATLSGNFELSVESEASDTNENRNTNINTKKSTNTKRRLLILFLRQLEVPDYKRAGRHTRDSRTPFVSGAAGLRLFSPKLKN
ncbi:MAG: hypothetical protein ACPGWR_03535 [Ardenticatenaceae bacterium]